MMSKREVANLLLLEAEVKDSLNLDLILKEIGSSWACISFPQPLPIQEKDLCIQVSWITQTVTVKYHVTDWLDFLDYGPYSIEFPIKEVQL